MSWMADPSGIAGADDLDRGNAEHEGRLAMLRDGLNGGSRDVAVKVALENETHAAGNERLGDQPEHRVRRPADALRARQVWRTEHIHEPLLDRVLRDQR